MMHTSSLLGWPMTLPFGGSLRLLARKVAMARRFIPRRPAGARAIRVPPMSSDWLRRHEAERNKHEPEV